jgi:DNA adenine methylase
MDKPQNGDVVYCDPPYTHSQSIIYGAQDFRIEELWQKIAECKSRGVKVMLSINGMRESKNKDISVALDRKRKSRASSPLNTMSCLNSLNR